MIQYLISPKGGYSRRIGPKDSKFYLKQRLIWDNQDKVFELKQVVGHTVECFVETLAVDEILCLRRLNAKERIITEFIKFVRIFNADQRSLQYQALSPSIPSFILFDLCLDKVAQILNI